MKLALNAARRLQALHMLSENTAATTTYEHSTPAAAALTSPCALLSVCLPPCPPASPLSLFLPPFPPAYPYVCLPALLLPAHSPCLPISLPTPATALCLPATTWPLSCEKEKEPAGRTQTACETDYIP